MAAQVDVEDCFDLVIANVSYKWDDLARKLGFKRGEINAIETTVSLHGPNHKCREVLERWIERNTSEAPLQVLKHALINIGERRTAESLEGAAAPPSGARGQGSHQRSQAPQQTVMTPPGSSTDFDMSGQGAAAPPSGSGGHGSPESHQTVMSPGTGNVPMTRQGPKVLLLNDEYGTSKGGVSTINLQAGQILIAANAVVYATALRVPKRDQEAADRDGIHLIQPVLLDEESVPTLDWLTKYHSVHFPHLPEDVTCIIGHADITDTAARNIWEQRYPQADLLTFTHVLPEDTEYYKGGRKAMKAWEKERDMLHKVDNAKAAFSVGPRIFDHYDTKYKGEKKPQDHYIFLPKPSELFLAKNVRPGGRQKVVLSIGRVRKVEKQKGHDLTAQSMGDVKRRIPNVKWDARGISEDDWETSKKILEDNLNSPDLNPNLMCYGTQEDILNDMMTAHLVLMPSRSEPFGLVGLEAIAAGIPVLISDKTGLAEMIKDLIAKKKLSAEHRHVIVETSVNDSDRASDVKRWADKIVEVLTYSDSEFEKAARLKRRSWWSPDTGRNPTAPSYRPAASRLEQ
ncbi:uncharacterized protein LOC144866664 [Branchiostoma floridae x Branchiostoma japonicum]